MAGPHSPNHTVGTGGSGNQSQPYPGSPPVDFPEQPTGGAAFAPAAGQPALAVPSPRRRPRRRLVIWLVVALAVAAVLTLAIVYGVRTNGANTGAAFSDASVKTAIQGYLDALEHRDTDAIVRNTLCGMYDGVHDKRSDQALAKLNSDAFRKQFSQVQVSSIDKIVYLSQYQAQALFSMQVSPSSGVPVHGPVQGVAQLLFQHGQILVCSYVLRAGGSY